MDELTGKPPERRPAASGAGRPGPRELHAMTLYASGRSIRSVAEDMGITEETVKSYLKRGRRAYRNAGVDVGTRTLLRELAIREGWLAAE
ncbi:MULTISPECIES: sigma factor-like helix-turn-helix DNA-binding protein [unclassified Salinibacterium]|uniref:sigma factor-like helix-turn-helix DNA-binding protein n=1 Tax=unclassified Salinibacterium TaxID=2632331 RepID=UPI001423D547|nr:MULTISPECIES: sigma factor-like helix-turn-helix DNA-binding protein [unclassified Salinibacterium]